MIKRLPYLFSGWMWYAITIAPVIGIIQISIAAPYAMADRYHYLPSIGLGVMLAWGMPALIKREAIRKKILFPAGIIFLAIIAFLSWNQCGYWKDSFTLFNHALEATKNNYLAHSNVGIILNKQGRDNEALYHYDKAISFNPYRASHYYDRGTLYGKHGQYQLAIEDFNQTIRLNSNYIKAYNNRGIVYNQMGIYQKALEDFNEAIRLKPDYADAYNNRAFIYLTHDNKELGCFDARKACELGNCKTLEAPKEKGLCR
jgi:tetratricopeptide (TPR) repeat protein